MLSTCLSIRTIQDFWHSTSTPYHHLQYSIHSVRVPSTHWILSLGALVFQPFRSLPQSTKGAMQSQVQLWVAASYCTVGTPCTVHTVCTYICGSTSRTYIACRGIRSVSVHVCAVGGCHTDISLCCHVTTCLLLRLPLVHQYVKCILVKVNKGRFESGMEAALQGKSYTLLH